MKISNIHNGQTFRGLNLSKVTPQDMKRVIEPCLTGLKKLAKKADIRLESSAVLQKFEHFQTPRPTINIFIDPYEGIKSKMALSGYSMIINKKNIQKKALLKIIKIHLKYYSQTNL